LYGENAIVVGNNQGGGIDKCCITADAKNLLQHKLCGEIEKLKTKYEEAVDSLMHRIDNTAQSGSYMDLARLTTESMILDYLSWRTNWKRTRRNAP